MQNEEWFDFQREFVLGNFITIRLYEDDITYERARHEVRPSKTISEDKTRYKRKNPVKYWYDV